MRRTKGEDSHPSAKWWLRKAASLKEVAGDPDGARRFSAQGMYETQFENILSQPSFSVLSPPQIWYFKNAYEVNTTNVWDEASAGSGTGLTVQDEDGGVGKFTNGTADNNNYAYFAKYETVKLEANKGIYLRTRIKIGDVDRADWFFGLCAQLGSGNLFDNRVDSIGFHGTSGSANISAECAKNGSATTSHGKGTLTDATWMPLCIHVDGTSRVYFFVNNAGVGPLAATLPDDEELCVAFGCRNGQAAANTMSITTIILAKDE